MLSMNGPLCCQRQWHYNGLLNNVCACSHDVLKENRSNVSEYVGISAFYRQQEGVSMHPPTPTHTSRAGVVMESSVVGCTETALSSNTFK